MVESLDGGATNEDEGEGAGPGLDWDLVSGGLDFAGARIDFPVIFEGWVGSALVLLVDPRLVDSFRGDE